MPKDRKRAPSTSDSDSGPEDRNPVKKVIVYVVKGNLSELVCTDARILGKAARKIVMRKNIYRVIAKKLCLVF